MEKKIDRPEVLKQHIENISLLYGVAVKVEKLIEKDLFPVGDKRILKRISVRT